MYPTAVWENADYGRIVNGKHFAWIGRLLEGADVKIGGRRDAETLQIEPAVVGHVSPADPLSAVYGVEAGTAGTVFAVRDILRLFCKFYLAQSEIDGMMS